MANHSMALKKKMGLAPKAKNPLAPKKPVAVKKVVIKKK